MITCNGISEKRYLTEKSKSFGLSMTTGIQSLVFVVAMDDYQVSHGKINYFFITSLTIQIPMYQYKNVHDNIKCLTFLIFYSATIYFLSQGRL